MTLSLALSLPPLGYPPLDNGFVIASSGSPGRPRPSSLLLSHGLCGELSLVLNVGGARLLASEGWSLPREGRENASFERRGPWFLGERPAASGHSGSTLSPCLSLPLADPARVRRFPQAP